MRPRSDGCILNVAVQNLCLPSVSLCRMVCDAFSVLANRNISVEKNQVRTLNTVRISGDVMMMSSPANRSEWDCNPSDFVPDVLRAA